MKLLAIAILLSACTGSTLASTTSSTTAMTTTSGVEATSSTREEVTGTTGGTVVIATPPDCPLPGETYTQDMADNGCMDGDEWVFYGYFDCADGSKLTADDEWWAYVDGPVIASEDTSTDPAYGLAYENC